MLAYLKVTEFFPRADAELFKFCCKVKTIDEKQLYLVIQSEFKKL